MSDMCFYTHERELFMENDEVHSWCDLVDAFTILTRDGLVLLSADARVTPQEDMILRKINRNMIERSKSNEHER